MPCSIAAISPLPHHPHIRSHAHRIPAARGSSGADRSKDKQLDASAGISITQHTCQLRDNGIRSAQHHICMRYLWLDTEEKKRRDAPSLSTHALSWCIPPRSRHLHWCHLGKCQLGALLGMGPKRSVGAHHIAHLCLCHARWQY